MLDLTRREFLSAAGSAGLAAAACGPGAAPAAPGSETGGAQGWEADWQKLASSARQEGQLTVVSLSGLGYRQVLDKFEEAFPGIQAELQSFSSASQIAPRVEKERAAGLYGWDIAIINTTTALKVMRPQGVWDPIRPAIFRPDVTNDKVWVDGFEAGFVDHERKWTYSFTNNISQLGINTEMVNESDLKDVTDLLDPKWRGKVLWGDVRWGGTYWPMTAVRLQAGEDVVKRLIVDQQPVFLRETRQMVEHAIRGGIAFGTFQRNTIREFWEQGVGKHVKLIQLPRYSYSSGQAIFLFNRAPHSDAAKLFINWLLSKEGQTAWTASFDDNSRRSDVPPANPDTLPIPGWKYVVMHSEVNLPEVEKTQELLERLVGITN